MAETNSGGVITIHHPESGGQTVIPAVALPAYEAKGWKEGPRPKQLEDAWNARVKARDERVRAERMARRKARQEARRAARQAKKED